jgi:hypothetical protein
MCEGRGRGKGGGRGGGEGGVEVGVGVVSFVLRFFFLVKKMEEKVGRVGWRGERA